MDRTSTREDTRDRTREDTRGRISFRKMVRVRESSTLRTHRTPS